MAILRRNNGQVSSSIWPGFVDAMTALLLVLMFVLTIFMIVQFVLTETITGQDVELENLSEQVTDQDTELLNLSEQLSGLADALGLEQIRTKGLEGEVSGLQGNLQSANTELDQQRALIGALTVQTENQKTQIVSFEQQVAGLLGQKTDLTNQLAETQASLSDIEVAQIKTISEKEAAQLALAQARGEIDLQTEQARLAAAKREALEALIAEQTTRLTSREAEIVALSEDITSLSNDLADEEKEKLKKIATLLALRERLTSSDEDLRKLQADITAKDGVLAQTDTKLAEAEAALTDTEKLRLIELAAAKALRQKLQGAQDELIAMTLALEEKRKQAEDTLTLLAAAKAATKQLADVADRRLSEQEKQAVLLAQANELLKGEKTLSADSQRKVALLNQETSALRGQLNSLQGLLDDANSKDKEAQIQIESLGSNLNTALARVASEQKRRAELEVIERQRLEAEAKDLKKFRSEFFGRLRDVLGSQAGIRIVGDRFVFSSEVLYTAGSAELGEQGKVEIQKIAGIIQDVATEIPPEIDWILRVDGHTDATPLSGFGLYRDNWELSQARALSVVKYLINDLGIPANRLAANGFGEFQPIVDGQGPEALALNRRIELKFTEK